MKRNLFLFLLCFFVMTGMTRAQNWFSYVGDYSSPRMIGIGMPFSWGYMLPASLMSEYQGCSITEFGFLDEVYEGNTEGNMTTLDMSSYQAGIYLVRVTTEKGEIVKRVLKQ